MAKQIMAKKTQPSPELLAANQRLLALRQQQTRRGREPEESTLSPQSIGPLDWTVLAKLPDHLGWGSAALTAVLRRRQSGQPTQETELTCQAAQSGPLEKRPSDRQPKLKREQPDRASEVAASVKLYPDIGLGMLRQGQESAGRVWLLCHHLDKQGCGSFRIDIITQNLSTRTSALYLCGKRQLRNLLRAGEGIYWTRDKERIWLRSAARVAASLGVEQLTGRPVALPLDALRKGIGAFRAHLYAAFHSGRAKERSDGRRTMPIARETLTGLSGVGASSQRTYEARAGVKAQANFAVGEAAARGGLEEHAWQQGQALFELKDYRGQQGQQGRTYLAWQLPNSYSGLHAQRPKGRQKRINRQLKDLVMKGMPGNVENVARKRKPVKRYFADGRSAGQALRQRNTADGLCYWQRPGNGRSAIWHPMGPA